MRERTKLRCADSHSPAPCARRAHAGPASCRGVWARSACVWADRAAHVGADGDRPRVHCHADRRRQRVGARAARRGRRAAVRDAAERPDAPATAGHEGNLGAHRDGAAARRMRAGRRRARARRTRTRASAGIGRAARADAALQPRGLLRLAVCARVDHRRVARAHAHAGSVGDARSRDRPPACASRGASHTAWYPARHGIPVAWNPARHSIPRGMVSRTVWYGYPTQMEWGARGRRRAVR